ncbi:MAG TPA: hypothetical protein DCP92_01230 [Nitrospiraceae bacterium]|nr:hypothetical protein [Nitrospiraceae bacterium]
MYRGVFPLHDESSYNAVFPLSSFLIPMALPDKDGEARIIPGAIPSMIYKDISAKHHTLLQNY